MLFILVLSSTTTVKFKIIIIKEKYSFVIEVNGLVIENARYWRRQWWRYNATEPPAITIRRYIFDAKYERFIRLILAEYDFLPFFFDSFFFCHKYIFLCTFFRMMIGDDGREQCKRFDVSASRRKKVENYQKCNFALVGQTQPFPF